MTRAGLSSRVRDRRGLAAIEFALVAPPMLLMIMGLGEIAYQGYMRSILTGAVQKAGRDATIQGVNTTAIDKQVLAQLQKLNTKVTILPANRRNYYSFSTAGMEDFDDNNGNKKYDAATECFYDLNGDKVRDDPGSNGQGGASSVTVYTVTIQYPRLFPMPHLLGWSPDATLTSTTILKNQPYEAPGAAPAVVKVCPTT